MSVPILIQRSAIVRRSQHSQAISRRGPDKDLNQTAELREWRLNLISVTHHPSGGLTIALLHRLKWIDFMNRPR
ncbi:MAG: hypothetical protein CMM01_02050 [Rhodopirellula sp.]|nr:hypothetical protein [Rhodopirellula sp.]